MLATLAALVAATLFTGAAVYINVAEQPARLALDDGACLAEWSRSYDRGLVMQVSLIAIGFALSLLGWWTTGRAAVLAGGTVLLANLPYTLLAILPVNRALKAMLADGKTAGGRALVARWGVLHAGRSALGTAATLLLGWAIAG